MPSSLNDRYFDFFGSSTICDERFLSSSNDSFIFFLVSWLSTVSSAVSEIRRPGPSQVRSPGWLGSPLQGH